MSVTNIPGKVKELLMAKSAGRCQFSGCNKLISVDYLTKRQGKFACFAHIVADSEDGPRGDKVLSPQLAKEISNIMVLCFDHHKLIDVEDVEGHPVELLKQMKNAHEARIELITSLQDTKESHVLLYGANIGSQASPLAWDIAASAMLPDWYPAERNGFQLSLVNSQYHDHEREYWEVESQNLRRLFDKYVSSRISQGDIKHLSVFALAPQPLLVLLGSMLPEHLSMEIYDVHRDPPDWKWRDHPAGFSYQVIRPPLQKENVALNLSLSATIDNSRVHEVLGEEVSIYTMTIDKPYNNFLDSKLQLDMFKKEFRLLLDEIKHIYGQSTPLHIFPAVRPAIAVEVGRCRTEKADMPYKLYDSKNDLFQLALSVG